MWPSTMIIGSNSPKIQRSQKEQKMGSFILDDPKIILQQKSKRFYRKY